jgi:hypothetical protein
MTTLPCGFFERAAGLRRARLQISGFRPQRLFIARLCEVTACRRHCWRRTRYSGLVLAACYAELRMLGRRRTIRTALKLPAREPDARPKNLRAAASRLYSASDAGSWFADSHISRGQRGRLRIGGVVPLGEVLRIDHRAKKRRRTNLYVGPHMVKSRGGWTDARGHHLRWAPKPAANQGTRDDRVTDVRGLLGRGVRLPWRVPIRARAAATMRRSAADARR